MSRSALLFAGLLAVTAVLPQFATADSVTITGLPTDEIVSANQTVQVQFGLEIVVDQGNCVAGSADNFMVTFKADATAGGDFVAQVLPASMAFNLPPGETAGGDATLTNHETLTLLIENRGNVPIEAANVTITATPENPDCRPVLGTVTPARLSETTGSVVVSFTPKSAPTTSGPTEQPVPGLELPALAAAVVALAILARRRKA